VIGLVPSIGTLATDAAVFAGLEPINHIHASTLAVALFWLTGISFAYVDRKENA